jgi:hypothetical protein
MLRIEKNSQGGTTTIRLIGHFEAEHLGELKNQLEDNGPEFVLDLKEVTIVDVEVVRFLGAREAEGVKIVHCPQYIRGWMARERTGLQRGTRRISRLPRLPLVTIQVHRGFSE